MKKAWIGGASLLTIGGLGVAIALTAGSPASAEPIGVLARAEAAGVPSLVQQRLALTVGLKPDAVAEVAQSSGAPVVILRGDSSRGRLVCISRDEQGAVGTSCAPEKTVGTDGLALYSAPAPETGVASQGLPSSGPVNVTVLEPNDVTRVTYRNSRGAARSAAVVNNVATLTVDGAPTTKSVQHANGTTEQLPVLGSK